MNSKTVKKIRKAVTISTQEHYKNFRTTVNELPLKNRIRITWRILWKKW